MKFEPGQRVIVLPEQKRNMLPEMREFIGKIVTISDVRGSCDEWPYRIVEKLRWVWKENFFASIVESTDPNLLFRLVKGK